MKKILTALCIFFTAIFLCSPCVFSQDNTTLINPDGTVNAPQKKAFLTFLKERRNSPYKILKAKDTMEPCLILKEILNTKKKALKAPPNNTAKRI